MRIHASRRQKATVNSTTGDTSFAPDSTLDSTLADTPMVQAATTDLAPAAAPAAAISQAADLPGNTTRVGDEFTVNTTKAGGQYFSTISTFADGGYVVSWTDTSYTEIGAGASSSQIRAQIFDKNNNKVG